MSHVHAAHAHTHEHEHEREHGHDHPHPGGENYAARPHPEFIVLDIGDEVGALIVHTGSEMHGMEVEISPAEDDGRRSHKDVLERSINGRPAYTAVFDGLREGAYTLWTEGAARARDVVIGGGAIVELDWSAGR